MKNINLRTVKTQVTTCDAFLTIKQYLHSTLTCRDRRLNLTVFLYFFSFKTEIYLRYIQ
ncbi:hypothetical protein JOC77_000429 [Peribacillus deserti]|uniref:Uncharacterized protein n=1 Tax=Peribacillus deserti TaxID=673318 RepID=A0ABS2QCY9_9BACI|nr:hypothetical protein [Peribacillus deserti]